MSELKGLLNNRLSNLLGKLRGSLLLNGLVAGLSLLFAGMTYRQIVRPLRQLEELAGNVRETKNYGLRMNSTVGTKSASLQPPSMRCSRSLPQPESARSLIRLATPRCKPSSRGSPVLPPWARWQPRSRTRSTNLSPRSSTMPTQGSAGSNREPPNTDEVRSALMRIVKDGERGSGIIESIRAMLKKGDQKKTRLNINELIYDVMQLTQGQFQRHGVSIRSELANDLPSILADRIQLQQVILNLFMNAAEAMSPSHDRERLVRVRSEKHDGGGALIAVEDSGRASNRRTRSGSLKHSLQRKQKGWGWAFQSAGQSWNHMAAA